MRILLIGEYSGVNTAIYAHLRMRNDHVVFLAEKDGWKDFGGESFFYKFGFKKLFYPLNFIYVLVNINRLVGYDYVFFLSPNFPGKLYFISGVYSLIFSLNKKVVYYACGTDYGYVSTQESIENSPYRLGGVIKPRFSYVDKRLFFWFTGRVSIIYSSSPDYARFFRDYVNYAGHRDLPIAPFEIGDVNVLGPKKNGCIKILHPISRADFKGSRYILDALNMLKDSSGLDIVIVERVSLIELEEHLRTTDILIDQCLGNGFGILAVLGMKFGCIVLTGFGDLDYCRFYPGIYNIDPDAKQIFNLLIYLTSLSEFELRRLQFNSHNYLNAMNKNNIKDIFC